MKTNLFLIAIIIPFLFHFCKKKTTAIQKPVLWQQRIVKTWLFLAWNKAENLKTAIIHKTSSFPQLLYLCYSDNDGQTGYKYGKY